MFTYMPYSVLTVNTVCLMINFECYLFLTYLVSFRQESLAHPASK
jgi:hypothetical protein